MHWYDSVLIQLFFSGITSKKLKASEQEKEENKTKMVQENSKLCDDVDSYDTDIIRKKKSNHDMSGIKRRRLEESDDEDTKEAAWMGGVNFLKFIYNQTHTYFFLKNNV